MSKHIVIFQTENEYTTFKASADYAEPNVAYIKETKAVYFNGQKMGGSGGGTTDILKGFIERTLETIEIPSTVTKIGGNAISSFTNITSLTIPSSVTKLDAYAISSNIFLESVKLPDTITDMEVGAFATDIALKNINIPTGITEIPPSCFSRNDLEAVVIPSNIKEIGYNAYESNLNLKSVIIEEGCEKIGQYVFNYCGALTYVSIPSTITEINHYAFYRIGNSADILIKATTPPTLGSSAFVAGNNIYVPDASLRQYQTATGWKTYYNNGQIKRISEYKPKS